MSLFENDQYRWRETYFVLFEEKNRPTAEDTVACLKKLGSRYEVTDVRRDDYGRFESLTLLSPMDYAAMDITYLAGEDVTAHVEELQRELKTASLTSAELAKLKRLPSCNARFDVYHFEQIVSDGDDEDEFLDPGALLIVLERLAKLCHGVGIDPQSGAVM
jgi:hypothetical protein